MSTLQAYAELRSLGQRFLRTGEVARRLRVPDSTAHATLKRLVDAGLAVHVRQGLWSLEPGADPLLLPAHLTGAFPAYVSFETALFYHDMIQQIPPRVTVASLHRSATIRTAVATYQVHRIPPALFGGFEDRDGIRLALAEKAAVDLAYVRAHRGWKSTRMPEIEVPAEFQPMEVASWVARIPSRRLQTMVRFALAGWGIPGATEVAGTPRQDSPGRNHRPGSASVSTPGA